MHKIKVIFKCAPSCENHYSIVQNWSHPLTQNNRIQSQWRVGMKQKDQQACQSTNHCQRLSEMPVTGKSMTFQVLKNQEFIISQRIINFHKNLHSRWNYRFKLLNWIELKCFNVVLEMLNENIMHRTPTICHFLIQLTKSFALEIKKISFSCSSDAHGQLFAKGFPSDTRRANI